MKFTIKDILLIILVSIFMLAATTGSIRSVFTNAEKDLATQYSLHPPIEDIVDGTYTVSNKQSINANTLYKLEISNPQYWLRSGFNDTSGINCIVDTIKDGIVFSDIYNVRMSNIVPNFVFEPASSNTGTFYCYAYLHNGNDSMYISQWAVGFKAIGAQVMDDDFRIYTNNSPAPYNFKDSLITFHYESTIAGHVWNRAIKLSFN